MSDRHQRRGKGPMLEFTRRQKAAVALFAAVAAAAVAAATAGWLRAALALLVALAVATAVAVMDLRGRLARTTAHLKGLSQRHGRIENAMQQSELRSQVDSLRSEVNSLRESNAAIQEALASVQTSHAELIRNVETATARERIAAVERHRELTDAMGNLTQLLRGFEREHVANVQALLQLFNAYEPVGPMPAPGHWALDAPSLLALTHVVSRRQPALVVECGSGTSSVWLGYAIRKSGRGSVVAVEHDAQFADRTRGMIRQHDLSDWVDVRLAPLTSVQLPDGTTQRWYDPSVLDDLDNIEVLVIDGPPGSTGPLARYPALPILEKRLAEDSVVFVDDSGRADERKMIERWLAEFPSLRATKTDLPRSTVLERTAS